MEADGSSFSLQSHEIGKDEIQSPKPRALTRSSSSIVTMSIKDIVIEAVRAIYQCSRYKDELPRDVYSRILSTLQSDHNEATSRRSPDSDWSDGSIWKHILEAGEARSRRSTIFDMLEYMGAWEWYDRQIKLTITKHEAEKQKELAPKTAASYVVLTDLQKLKTPGKSIKGIGKLTLEEGRDIRKRDEQSIAEKKIARKERKYPHATFKRPQVERHIGKRTRPRNFIQSRDLVSAASNRYLSVTEITFTQGIRPNEYRATRGTNQGCPGGPHLGPTFRVQEF